MSIKCPNCQQNVTTVFKCDFCGDLRCNATFSNGDKGTCGSSKSPFGKPQGAADAKTCYVCKKGKYKKL
jgi:hypothetical protein